VEDDASEMSEGCRQNLRKQVMRENMNLAFNLRVKRECAVDLPRLCRADGDDDSVVRAAAAADVGGREDPLTCLIDARTQVATLNPKP